MTQTITLNNVEHAVDQLPQNIQYLIDLYSDWNRELDEAKIAVEQAKINVFKLEAAIIGITGEIETRVKALSLTK